MVGAFERSLLRIQPLARSPEMTIWQLSMAVSLIGQAALMLWSWRRARLMVAPMRGHLPGWAGWFADHGWVAVSMPIAEAVVLGGGGFWA